MYYSLLCIVTSRAEVLMKSFFSKSINLLTHAESSILPVAVYTDTVVAAYGVLTVGIHITHVGTKNTFINIWEWRMG